MCFKMNNKLINANGKILDGQNNKNNKRCGYYVKNIWSSLQKIT